MRTWNELIAREHPQGKRRLVGRQLRYLFASEHGWLGAIGFSASALQLEARDRWIGWTRGQRLRHEGRVVNLSRFLIRPSVRCRNLASHVLGVCVRRVGRDFETRYGYRPWLLESFVDGERHAGTCFQAANWERIGRTKGRGRNDSGRRSLQSVKDIYVYPLEAEFPSQWECQRNEVATHAPCLWSMVTARRSGRSRSSGRWSWGTSGCGPFDQDR